MIKKGENNMRDMAILVCSCDKYEDVWKPMFEMFYKFWENCPYNVYLMTNNASIHHPKVKTLSTGDDITWSKAFRNALERIEVLCSYYYGRLYPSVKSKK